MIVLLTLLTILAAIPLVWWHFHMKKYDVFKKIPGPRPLPLIGNQLEMGRSPKDIFKGLNKCCRDYGFVFKLFVGPRMKVIFAAPEEVEYLLSSNTHVSKTNAYDLLQPWFGDGLITSSGQKWRNRRRLINPCFHLSVLEKFEDTYNDNAEIFADKLSLYAGKGGFDIFPFINLCTMDILCETSMGVKVGAQNNKNNVYARSVRGFIDLFAIRVFSVWKQFEFSFQFSSQYKFHKKYVEAMHKFSNDVITEKRKELIKNSNNNNNTKTIIEDGPKPKIPLLEMLLGFEKDNIIDDTAVRAEIDTFMAAGHDTISATIGFVIYCLAMHPDVQQKCFEEVEAVVGDDTNLTMTHINNLKYMDMVVKESMRIYTPVPYVERKIHVDSTINGQFYPAGTIVAVYIHGLHNNPAVYPEPHKFDPDRFLHENRVNRSVYSHIPFSAGPRNCIGQRIAMFEIKAVLVKMLKKYRILPVPGFKLDLGLTTTLRSYSGIQVQIEGR